MSNTEILYTVVENGRVQGNDDGSFNRESLEVEVEFEATEQGLSEDQVKECVEYALEHTRHD